MRPGQPWVRLARALKISDTVNVLYLFSIICLCVFINFFLLHRKYLFLLTDFSNTPNRLSNCPAYEEPGVQIGTNYNHPCSNPLFPPPDIETSLSSKNSLSLPQRLWNTRAPVLSDLYFFCGRKRRRRRRRKRKRRKGKRQRKKKASSGNPNFPIWVKMNNPWGLLSESLKYSQLCQLFLWLAIRGHGEERGMWASVTWQYWTLCCPEDASRMNDSLLLYRY